MQRNITEEEAAIIRAARQRCLDEFAMCRDSSLLDQHGIGVDVRLEYARIVSESGWYPAQSKRGTE